MSYSPEYYFDGKLVENVLSLKITENGSACPSAVIVYEKKIPGRIDIKFFSGFLNGLKHYDAKMRFSLGTKPRFPLTSKEARHERRTTSETD